MHVPEILYFIGLKNIDFSQVLVRILVMEATLQSELMFVLRAVMHFMR